MSATRMNGVWWTLRVGAAACFIGHGAFGIITKEAWLPFFALVGIGPDAAYTLMPIIGTVDILAGLTVLFQPRPAVLAYMAVWAFWTAALRPITGDRVGELLERAGNYGVPFALLLMIEWPTQLRDWFAPARRRAIDGVQASRLGVTLVTTAVVLLVGHAVLGIQEKQLLVRHYTAGGVGSGAATASLVGQFELALATLLVGLPSALVAGVVLVWKLVTESLFLVNGEPIWEFVERGGSYAAPLALLFIARTYRLPRLLGGRLMPRAGVAASLAIIASIAVPTRSEAQSAPTKPATMPDDQLLAKLRAGGLAIACRHAITSHAVEDKMPIDYTNRDAQRNLSSAGEGQARALGESFRAAKIPVGQVFANPFFRTRETATLAFGKVEVIDTLGNAGVLKRLMMQRVPPGENRIFVTRNGMLSNAFQGSGLGMFEEGDCGIAEPGDSAIRPLARLTPADFARLGAQIK